MATKEKKRLYQVVRRLGRKVTSLRNELKRKEIEMHNKTSLLRKPKKEKARKTLRGVVSLAGGYRCGIRRNVGHVGAIALLAHLDSDVSRLGLSVSEI